MRAILKRFADSKSNVKVTYKSDLSTQNKKIFSKNRKPLSIFEAFECLSQEGERHFSHPIENRFLSEVNNLVQGRNVSDHIAISEYYLLWKIRHYYKSNPAKTYNIFDGKNDEAEGAAVLEDIDIAVNSFEKCLVSSSGIVRGKYANTLSMKSDFQIYRESFSKYSWSVLESDSDPFVSADRYETTLAVPISPSILLMVLTSAEPRLVVSPTFIKQFRQVSLSQCCDFVFENPNY